MLGAGATDGHDPLTLLLPGRIAPFGAWVEQLVAESTGKHDVGLLPILDEPVFPPSGTATGGWSSRTESTTASTT